MDNYDQPRYLIFSCLGHTKHGGNHRFFGQELGGGES